MDIHERIAAIERYQERLAQNALERKHTYILSNPCAEHNLTYDVPLWSEYRVTLTDPTEEDNTDMAGPGKPRPPKAQSRNSVSRMPEDMPSFIPTSTLNFDHPDVIKFRDELKREEEIAKKRKIEALRESIAEQEALLTRLVKEDEPEQKERRLDLNL